MSARFLQFQNVSFSYPTMTRPLLTGLNLHFPCGWTGVVGANGVGKSTVLKLAVGDLQPQSGTIFRHGTARYCAQRTDDPPAGREAFLADLNSDALTLRRQLELEESWFSRWDTLSHGERKRAQIAVALWFDPEILALDEPTNHIDADTRAMLAAALRRFRGVGLLVSHDRDLLDDLCGQCLFLDPPAAIIRPGGVTQGSGQAGIELETVRRDDDRAKRAIHRLRKETQRRRETADRVAAKVKVAKQKKPPVHDHDGRAMRNLAKLTGKDAFAGKLIAQLDSRARRAGEARSRIKVPKIYELGIWLTGQVCSPRAFLCRLPAGELPLGDGKWLEFPELLIRPTDRIALTGANGLGKSTLVRRLLGGLAGQDHADSAKAENVLNVESERVIYVPQEISRLESQRLFREIAALPKDRLGQIMTIVSRLGSRPQRLLESEEPSPGEIRKILLALGIARGPHLIVMDEPTNHMDLPSIECLEDALGDCPCGMLLVSHDLRFLGALTTIHWHIARQTATQARVTVSFPG